MKKFIGLLIILLLTGCKVNERCASCEGKDTCSRYQTYLKNVANGTIKKEDVVSEEIWEEAMKKYGKEEEEPKPKIEIHQRFVVLDEDHIALIDSTGKYIVYEKLLKY